MSLLTRCPACTTVYRVVPDQLRISQGWVKCGQCGDIFDATQHLIQAAIVPEGVPHDPTSTLPDVTGNASEAFDTEGEEGERAQNETDIVESSEQTVEDLDLKQVESSLQLADSQPVVNNVGGFERPQQVGVHEDMNPAFANPAEEPLADLQTLSACGGDHGEKFELVSFMKQASGQSFWKRRAVSGVLWLLAVWLGVGLAGQWIVQERDRLATWHPELKPVLHAFCEVLLCSVGPLQQIESVAVDSAAFYTLGADRYRLSFILKNSALLAVALPSVEITLTDALDRAVVRRVLSSAELAVEADRLGPASEWPVTMVLQVTTGASVAKVVGYRLLAFYP
jgi:predicted Zn finger-like uncharacterized protein